MTDNTEQQIKIFSSINDNSNLESSQNDTNMNIKYEGALTTEDENSQRNLRKDLNNSISFVSTSSENVRISVSVFGNDIKVERPLKIGKCFAFLYFKGFPIITLGPECKIFTS